MNLKFLLRFFLFLKLNNFVNSFSDFYISILNINKYKFLFFNFSCYINNNININYLYLFIFEIRYNLYLVYSFSKLFFIVKNINKIFNKQLVIPSSFNIKIDSFLYFFLKNIWKLHDVVFIMNI